MTARFGILLVPLAIALGTLPLGENSGLIMRPLLALVIVIGLFSFRDGIWPSELVWLLLLVCYFLACALSAVGSVVPEMVPTDLQRQIFMLLLATALLFMFRDPRVRLVGLRGLVILLLVSVALGAWVYVVLGPVYGISYEGLRFIKGAALVEHDIGLNIIAYLSVIAILGLKIAYRWGRLGNALLVGGGLACIFLLASRASIFALILAWAVVAGLRQAGRMSPLLAVLGVPLAGGLFLLVALIAGDYAVAVRDMFGLDTARELSVGRTDMWAAGLEMFFSRPLFGWGADSWKVLILEFLPWATERTLHVISNLEGGGFHNAFVSVAAERGGIGLMAALGIQGYLFWCAFRIANARHCLPPGEDAAAAVVPVLVLFIFLRGLAESSGLFGAANSEADYLSYFVASYVVALHAEVQRHRAQAMRDAYGTALPAGA